MNYAPEKRQHPGYGEPPSRTKQRIYDGDSFYGPSDGYYEERGSYDDNERRREAPSRVLLFRNLPTVTTEPDIESICRPFCMDIEPVIFFKTSSGHAFVQFPDEVCATDALEHFRLNGISSTLGSRAQVGYSKRDTVTKGEDKPSSDSYRIVLVSIANLSYTVDLDLLHQIFSKYGFLEKIVIFALPTTSRGAYQALIQFSEPMEARQALQQLNNRNIYDGCNTLQIQPSRWHDLSVKQNSARSWDYTIPQRRSSSILPTPEDYRSQPIIPRTETPGRGDHSRHSSYSSTEPGNRLLSRIDKLSKDAKDMCGECLMNKAPVLMVYKITPNEVDVQKIFNLFSLYGCVTRVKILREKPDTAMVQYSEPIYATIAKGYLHNIPFFDRDAPMQIAISRNPEVKLPNPGGDEGCSRTREFSVREQRYTPSHGDEFEKYIRGVCKPTATLFLIGLPDNVTEEELVDLFSQYGDVRKFVFRTAQGRRKTAYVQMESEHAAVVALANLHNHRMSDMVLKVSFSRSII